MHEQTPYEAAYGPVSEPYAGLTKAEELSLKQADEKLRLAHQEYAKLEYLRQKRSAYHLKMWHSRRKKRRAAERIDVSERIKECRSPQRTSREIQNSFPRKIKRDADTQMSGEEIVSLYRELASLDALAKHLSLTRKTAIYKLRTAGVDVIEEIAVAWQNGLALRHLSAQHGPLPQTISKWIKSTGRQIKPRNSNPKYDQRRLQECFELGWTTNRIAKTMGLSWSTVQYARST